MTREEHIIAYYPKVQKMASIICRTLPKSVLYEDIVSIGTIGLIEAVDRFDPDKNIKFNSYAERIIKGRILDGLREIDTVSKEERRKIKKRENIKDKLEQKLKRRVTDSEVEELFPRYPQPWGQDPGLQFKKPLKDARKIRDKQDSILVTLEREELKNKLFTLINILPLKSKKLIKCYFYQDLTMRQIGKKERMCESNISQRLTKIKKTLKMKLEENL